MRGIQGITLLAITVISITYLFGTIPEASAQVDEFTITKVSDGTETILLDPGGGGPWTAGAISAADCTGASTGVASDIITTFPGAWDPAGTISGAVWISSDPAGGEKPPGSDTFLIAVPFSVHPDSFEVTLDFDFLSDNWLGDDTNPNAGLFINCSPLGGSTVTGTGLFKNFNSVGPFDITSLLDPDGTSNTLFILSTNEDPTSPGGIQYAATISVDSCSPGDDFCDLEVELVSDGTETILLDPGGGGPWTAGAISPTDCTDASGGVASDIITTFPGAWEPAGTIPGAVWISSDPDGGEKPPGSDTFLIAVEFDVSAIGGGSVTLDFDFLSDNWLGDAANPNAGLFINCSPVAGSTVVAAGLFKAVNSLGPSDITSLLKTDGTTNTLFILSTNADPTSPGGIQYGATISNVLPVGPTKTSGDAGHEPPTIGKSLDGVRQVVDGGIAIDGQTWTVTQGYHQEFELVQMLTSPHTISNVIHCAKGVEYCNYIAVGFMGLTDDFNNPVMTVSASKDHLNNWTIDWYDPDNYIADPSDAVPKDIVFVPQIIDNRLLGTSFTIDFNNKDTGQLKMGIQVRDSYNGVRNFFFNEGVEFIDADAYPQVETAYDTPVEVERVCFGQNNPDRNSCQFDKMQDWATANAEDTLRQMTNNQYQYDQ